MLEYFLAVVLGYLVGFTMCRAQVVDHYPQSAGRHALWIIDSLRAIVSHNADPTCILSALDRLQKDVVEGRVRFTIPRGIRHRGNVEVEAEAAWLNNLLHDPE